MEEERRTNCDDESVQEVKDEEQGPEEDGQRDGKDQKKKE